MVWHLIQHLCVFRVFAITWALILTAVEKTLTKGAVFGTISF